MLRVSPPSFTYWIIAFPSPQLCWLYRCIHPDICNDFLSFLQNSSGCTVFPCTQAQMAGALTSCLVLTALSMDAELSYLDPPATQVLLYITSNHSSSCHLTSSVARCLWLPLAVFPPGRLNLLGQPYLLEWSPSSSHIFRLCVLHCKGASWWSHSMADIAFSSIVTTSAFSAMLYCLGSRTPCFFLCSHSDNVSTHKFSLVFLTVSLASWRRHYQFVFVGLVIKCVMLILYTGNHTALE